VDSWSLTVAVPASDLVRRKGRIVRRALGIPALHNLRGALAGSAVVKAHKAALDAGLLAEPMMRRVGGELKFRLRHGERFDVLLIRRAPRPLDCAIQGSGDWKQGRRDIYGDNLESSLKAARDWVAKRVLGLDGDSGPLIRWHAGQERSGRPRLHQIAILIRPAPAEIARCCELPVRWLRGEL
jgi:hypothetical protein